MNIRRNIFFSLTIFFLFCQGSVIGQETPPLMAPARDTLVDLKKRSFIDKMAEQYGKDTILPNKKGLVGKPGSTIGIGYRIRTTKHGQKPFGSQHSLTINYGISRGAFFIEHKSDFNQVIGNWSMKILTRFDLKNVINYYGRGNETIVEREEDYYQLNSKEYLVSLGFGNVFKKYNEFAILGFFQSIKLNYEDSNYILTEVPDLKTNNVTKNFLGLTTGYRYFNKDNNMAPTKGIEVGIRATYFGDLQENADGFLRFITFVNTYLPINKNLTVASRIGFATIAGDPQFYQLNILGGRENLRGYPRQRFYGTTSLFTNQELRFLFQTGSKLFQKIGFLGFIDAGRVWEEDEISHNIHVGYGGGIIIIPFNKIVLNASYGISEEDRMTHLRVGYFF